MLLRAVDFEFTGEPTEEDRHALIEVGACDIYFEDGEVEIARPWSVLCNPHRPIPASSMAVHHISDAEAATGVAPETAFLRLMGSDGELPRPDYFVSHNVEAEKAFFGGGGIEWICTYRAAVRLWPDEESHKLQNLRYSLKLPVNQKLGLPAHRAGPDAYIGAALMAAILQTKMSHVDLKTLVRWSKGHPLFTRINFSEYKGQKFIDVPDSMLNWIINKKGMDPVKVANAKYWLKAKMAAQ